MQLTELPHGVVPSPDTAAKYKSLFDWQIPQLVSYCPSCRIAGHINDMLLDAGCSICADPNIISTVGVWRSSGMYGWAYMSWHVAGVDAEPITVPITYPREQFVSVYTTIYAGMANSCYPYTHDEKHAIAMREAKAAMNDIISCTAESVSVYSGYDRYVDTELRHYMQKLGIHRHYPLGGM